MSLKSTLSEKIISFIDNHSQEQLKFIVDLCNQNSYTYNKRGSDEVAEMILSEIAGLLPHHIALNQDNVGCHHVLSNHKNKRAIYLIGHLDTVYPPDHELQTCRLEGGLLYGPGTSDMKGGIGVIVYALKALHGADALDGINVTLILNSDEEIGSVTSSSLFERERKYATECLVAECGGPGGTLVVSRNGKIGARIDCYGEDCHVSAATDRKASAVLELSHQIIGLEALNAFLSGVSVNVGKVEGGLGPCTIAGHASALVDIRWTEEEHRQVLCEAVKRSLSEHGQPDCRSVYTVLNSRPAMPCNRETKILFERIQKIGRRLGQVLNAEHRRGTSDANFFGAAGIPTVDGFGPTGYGEHTAGEYIDIASLKGRTALLAHVLIGLTMMNG
jgi:glutamate carboxypeptidase